MVAELFISYMLTYENLLFKEHQKKARGLSS